MTFQYGRPLSDPTIRKPKKEMHPVCLSCGYDMRGNQSGNCPECGQAFIYSHWERAERDVKQQISDVDSGLASARYAWIVAVAGIAIRGASILLLEGSCMGTLIRVLGFLTGIVAICLSLNIFRAGKLPVWARDHLARSPAYGSAIVGIVGGIALIVAGIVFK